MFCEQVVDQTLLNKYVYFRGSTQGCGEVVQKDGCAALEAWGQDTDPRRPEIMSAAAQQAMYKAVVDFIEAEYVKGNSESGQACECIDGPVVGDMRTNVLAVLRNKLAYTIAHLFLNTYPATIPTFLHPFLNLLVPSDSATSLNPSLLVIHLLIEIALEIHDNIIKSARAWSNERQLRDGSIREVIRSSGDERMAVEGLLSLANKGVGLSKGNAKWLEVTQAALKALGHWTRELSKVLFS